MRNLLVCCDGTWNTQDDKQGGIPSPTNVVRLYNALAERNDQGVEQLRYYHPGVGTDGGWWEKLVGGGLGIGLDGNIMSAYRWLGTNYQPGDRIFLFGFSRGAFTVRSLGGMISACGLLDLAGLPEPEVWARVEAAYRQGYRNRDGRNWSAGWPFHPGKAADGKVPVYFLGVWDTVGALGIPNDLSILNLLDDPKRYFFHDTELSGSVLNARHAVALDEKRASFAPTLWSNIAGRPDVKQVWFPGVHCDVGGGYLEKGLSDGALKWMMDEAGRQGLGFRPGMYAQVAPNPQDVLHDSASGVFRLLRTQPRSIPPVSSASQAGALHQSALDRQDSPPITHAPYYPTTMLKPGEEKSLQIFAAQHWNYTGIYLETDARYAFQASGEWLDSHIKCGPEGPKKDTFQAGELAQMLGAAWGKIEIAYKAITQNQDADFKGTRREEDKPWFALIGAIANGGNPNPDGTPVPSETFLIGAGCEYPPQGGAMAKPGYLYCFANDAWDFYGNNRGSVTLTVRRLA